MSEYRTPCLTVAINSHLKEAVYSSSITRTRVILNFNPKVTVTQSILEITLFDVINNIGSSMGLWIGISVFSTFKTIRRFKPIKIRDDNKKEAVFKNSLIGFCTLLGLLFVTFVVTIFLFSQAEKILSV